MRNPTIRYALAATICALLVLHTRSWPVDQLLWACHVASFVIAVGLALGHEKLIAYGTLFHAGQGIPAYILDLIVVGENSVTSVLLHVLPIAAGLWALWGRPLPRTILLGAWLIQPMSMVLAYLFTDPALNVMLVHKPYELTEAWFPTLWMSWLGNLAMSFACLLIGWLVLRWLWRKW
jgi:hypothetical protein